MQKKILRYSKSGSVLKKLSFLLFPPHCVVCGKITNGGNICENCFKKIDFLEYPLIEHHKNVFFYAITNYDGVSGEIIKKLKFRRLKSLSFDIAEIFADFIKEEGINTNFVSYVPMTANDENRRGFNQSKLIAKNLSLIINAKFFDGVEKTKKTKKQVGLSKNERIKNIKNAFAVKDKVPGNLVIVDDVYTTGATAHSVTRAFSVKTHFNIYFIAFSRRI